VNSSYLKTSSQNVPRIKISQVAQDVSYTLRIQKRNNPTFLVIYVECPFSRAWGPFRSSCRLLRAKNSSSKDCARASSSAFHGSDCVTITSLPGGWRTTCTAVDGNNCLVSRSPQWGARLWELDQDDYTIKHKMSLESSLSRTSHPAWAT
jgi:hypothetical protein